MKIVDVERVAAEGVSHDPAIRKKVLLRAGDVPHVAQLAQATFEPGQVARGHAHTDMWEIFWCTAGDGVLQVRDREIAMVPGRCVVIEPGEVHELRNTGATPMLITVIAVVQ
jgi:quercetin dioxygenase-like cupin family protein